MADPNELTKRQETYVAKAKAVTLEQLDIAGEILRANMSMKAVAPELVIALAQVIATNYAAEITNTGLGRIK